MEISFDPVKRAQVLKKHGLDLQDAAELLAGDCIEVADDRFDYGEDRYLSIGHLSGKLVVCVWADWGDDHVRVISMREATRNEQDWFYRHADGR